MNIAVAMSGGVDSSVAAALLREQGHSVFGVTMRLPRFDGGGASVDAPAEDAACSVAEQLDIPLHVLDVRDEFEREIVGDFCESYAAGRTPNACVLCNRLIKFGQLLDHACTLGADAMATGHYVRTDECGGRFRLLQAPTRRDQSYFLCRLTQAQLARVRFPLGDWEKADVRRKAADLGLDVHDRPDSQDICFLADGGYRAFLRRRVPQAFTPGALLHVDGTALGEHAGLGAYTIGQRRGIGVAWPAPLYVVALRAADNTVIVGEKRHLARRRMAVRDVNWIAIAEPQEPVSATVRIRYRHPGSDAVVTSCPDGAALVEFTEAQDAACPGQAAVFYDGPVLLGGGTINDMETLR
jgi:tRNA-uridine 2-sulfurtransferase